MDNSGIPAVFAINSYFWNQIKDKGLLKLSDYRGLSPILPIQESAAFQQAMDSADGIGQKPYIIYTWYTNSIGPNDWYKQTDTLTYTIYSADQSLLRKLHQLAVTLFKRFDDSAVSVNNYKELNLDAAKYGRYDFKTISVVAANAGTPAGYENDPNAASVTIRVQYTDDDNDTDLP